MKTKLFLFVIAALLYAGCGDNHSSTSGNEPENQNEHSTEHEHEEAEHAHESGEIKIRLTAYSNSFEVYAEADPFVAGQSSNVLAHFTKLPGFEPLESGSVSLSLNINGNETSQTLPQPDRKGIYSFNVEPGKTGSGEIVFQINSGDSVYAVHVPEVTVFEDEHDAIHEAEEAEVSAANAITFTKEQSWKIDFATEQAKKEPFGEVIKTTALVRSAPGDETLVTAKTSGTVNFSTNKLVEGESVSKNQVLFSVSGSGFADNNSQVRFAEAKNNFEQAKADYERAMKLAEDKIVSQKDLLEAKNNYENAKAVYDNLNSNFNSAGQTVTSPMKGYVKQLFIQNGEYVVAGQPLIGISQNQNLLLHAEVQQKYLPVLGAIQSANIHALNDKKTYTLEELNGKIVSYGKTAGNHNFLLPVSLQINNKGSFIPGGFVELYLKTVTNAQAITVPNSALLEEQGNFFVMAQITPELFEKREVKTGASDGRRTEIINGITENDRVITSGAVLVKLSQSTGTLDAHSGHVH